MVRPHNTNGEALLAQAIQSINWTPLYQMDTCEEMTACFYDTIIGLIDYYLPLQKVKRHSTDKPWVTDQFRRLIRCRQNPLKIGQVDRYKTRSSGRQSICGGSSTPGRLTTCGIAINVIGGACEADNWPQPTVNSVTTESGQSFPRW